MILLVYVKIYVFIIVSSLLQYFSFKEKSVCVCGGIMLRRDLFRMGEMRN